MTNVIQSCLDEHSQLLSALAGDAHISLRLVIDRYFQKILIVAAASYCEDLVKNIILEFASLSSAKNDEIVNLIKNKAIERQYHTLFDWTTNSAVGINKFWALFGDNRKKRIAEIVKNDQTLNVKAEAFIQIGQLRNQLVHGNFAAMSIDLTIDEIGSKSELALGYVDFIRVQLVPEQSTTGG